MKKVLIIAFILIHSNLNAQDYEWVKFYQGQYAQLPVSLSVDKAGNQYATFNFYRTIEFDSMTVTQTNNYQYGLVIKQDASGKTLWHRVIEPLGTNVYTVKSMFNSKGNLLVFVSSTKSIVVNNDTIQRQGTNNYALYLIEFNDTGGIVYSKHLIEGNLGSINYQHNKIFSDIDDNIYLGLIYNGDVKVYDTTGTVTLSGTANRNIVFKFSPSGGNLEWTRIFPHSAIWMNSLKVDINQNVYVATYWAGNSSFVFKGSSISNPSSIGTGVVFILDKNGNDKNWFYIKGSANLSTIYDIAVHDTNSVFISGAYLGDSARFDMLWKKNKKYGVYDFYARYKADGSQAWVKVEDTTYSISLFYPNYYGSMTHYSDQYFYLSTYDPYNYNRHVSYDGQKYSQNVDGFGFNIKVDDRGNILWGFKTFYPFIGIGTDQNSNFYFQGWWLNDTIRFGKFKAFPNSYDAFIGKTFDYAIYRGPVYAGPYCAGDTILIPYTRHGNFADTNTFFAELSDEFGNFNGGQRILGQITTNKDSTIIGQLPLFQVASSQKYRIRIRSTSPQAQSYYTEDSLRLLIYSRDKADPGPTETICRGDTFQLNTFGGTKWSWSPNFRMNDSTLRQALVWPDSTSIYKIVIDDSSGCGEPDTAYKTLIVRNDPNVKISASNIAVCMKSNVELISNFAEGDSSNYHWRWFTVNDNNEWLLQKSDNYNLVDTFIYSLPHTVIDSIKIAVVFTDSCSPNVDTAYHTIYIKQHKPNTLLNIVDTTICPGTDFQLTATFSNDNNPAYYQWQWLEQFDMPGINTIEKDSGKNSDTITIGLPLTPIIPKQIYLVLNDNCSPINDTVSMQIQPRSKLHLSPQIYDTTLCIGNKIKWKTKGLGGNPEQYIQSWFVNGQLFSQSDSFEIIADSNTSIRVILSDGCMPENDSLHFNVFVRPPLQIQAWSNSRELRDTILCYGQTVSIQSLGNGGDSMQYKYEWLWQNQTIASSKDFFFDSKTVQSNTSDSSFNGILILVLKDGCTIDNDTTQISIEVLPPLKVSGFSPDTICFGQTAWQHASGVGGNGLYKYSWYDSSFAKLITNDSNLLHHNNHDYFGNFRSRVILEDACTTVPDTALFITFLKPKPQLLLNIFDTMVCKGSRVVYKARPKHSNINAPYQFIWMHGNMNISLSDSLVLIGDTDKQISVIMTDGCSLYNDTVNFNLNVYPALNARVFSAGVLVEDTTLCYGQSLRLDANGFGGNNSAYTYRWMFNDSLLDIQNQIIISKQTSADYTYSLKDTGYNIITLIMGDNCTVLNDTITINFNLLSPIVVIASAPDSICYGNSVWLSASATGGNGNYQFKWLNSSDIEVSTNSNYLLQHQLDAQKRIVSYSVIANDGCTTDTASSNVLLLPNLDLDIQSLDSCVTSQTTLNSTFSGGKGFDYKIKWFENNDSIAFNVNTLPVNLFQNTLYKAVLYDGCSQASDTAFRQIGIIPKIELIASPSEGCEMLPVQFILRTNYIGAFRWNLNYEDGDVRENITAKDSVQIHHYSVGNYSAEAEIKTLLGCVNAIKSSTIVVHPKPNSSFSWHPEFPTLDNPEILLNNTSTGAIKWYWDFNSLGSSDLINPTLRFIDTGIYTIELIAISDKECKDTFTNSVIVTVDYKLFIPNTFTPGSNGINDTWIPYASGIQYFQYTIWNRWGEIIFIGDDTTPWDGTYQGEIVQEGTYMYTIEVRNKFGTREFLNGIITVLR